MAGLDPPLALVAELTHRCPLHCLYCSNPLNLVPQEAELNTEAWLRVFREAATLGILQLLLSGGEPLARKDLVALVAGAVKVGLYPVLITSGVGLDRKRLRALKEAGLAAVQLSFQALEPGLARRLAGGEFLDHKLQAARWVREEGLPLTLNVVLHRLNLHEIETYLDLARDLGAIAIELANTQYYGWAWLNRAHLLPEKKSLEAAYAKVQAWRARNPGVMEVVWVVPDFYAEYPKPCMGGWGATHLVVSPDGRALPCPAALLLPLDFPKVTEVSLEEIWYYSEAFNLFRGTGWMQEPCRSCPRKEIDFGGCRCQAYMVTGDLTATDPVCRFSPWRERWPSPESGGPWPRGRSNPG